MPQMQAPGILSFAEKFDIAGAAMSITVCLWHVHA